MKSKKRGAHRLVGQRYRVWLGMCWRRGLPGSERHLVAGVGGGIEEGVTRKVGVGKYPLELCGDW